MRNNYALLMGLYILMELKFKEKNMDVIKLKRIATSSLIISGMLLTTPTLAASSCKGMIESDCAGTASCRWIDSYTRKDGITINAYCRSKPKSKLAGEKAVDKKVVEKKPVEKTKTAS